MVTHWSALPLRQRPALSARTKLTQVPDRLKPFLDARFARLSEPLEGISMGGTVRPGLYPLGRTGVDTQPVLDAALAFLDAIWDP